MSDEESPAIPSEPTTAPERAKVPWLAIGVAIGTALGVASGAIAVGVGIGVGLGAALQAVQAIRRR